MERQSNIKVVQLAEISKNKYREKIYDEIFGLLLALGIVEADIKRWDKLYPMDEEAIASIRADLLYLQRRFI